MSAASSAAGSSLQALLDAPSLERLLIWCGEHCDNVRDGLVNCFPHDMRERAEFWSAIRKVANTFAVATTAYDVAVFYPGRDADERVLRENDLADALRSEFGRRGKTAYYADLDRDGRFDRNIGEVVLSCRKAVFVVSRTWFERKWCLAEMLLAIISNNGDDRRCKVIEYGYGEKFDDLLPLHKRVLRARFNDTKLLSEEAVRLTDWVLNSPAAAAPSLRPVRAVVLSAAMDADAFAKRVAPARRHTIVPATDVCGVHMRVLADVAQADAPVLVVVQLPAVVDDDVQADIDALFVALRQPPKQVVPAALFDASPIDRLLLSRAAIVDTSFRPQTEPAAEWSDACKDVLHRVANSVKSHAERLSIAYVPADERVTLLKTVSEQWIAHTVDPRAFKFAFLKLHNATGDALADRIGDWSVFEAAFAAAFPTGSSVHYLVLPGHVGALVACLVRGGVWARYLEWLAAQEGAISVLGLRECEVDKAAVARLLALGSDGADYFASAHEIEERVGASVWRDDANWIGGYAMAGLRGDLDQGGPIGDATTPVIWQPLNSPRAMSSSVGLFNTLDEGQLSLAAHRGQLAVIEQLLQDNPVDPMVLHATIRDAAEHGHLAVVERLLQDKRVDPSVPLGEFAAGGQLKPVEWLLQDKHVDPSAHNNRAIRRAAENGHLAVVERLLQDKRVDPNAALGGFAAGGHLNEVERLLIDKRVDPSADKNDAIRHAAENGHLAVVERLLQDGRVDPSADDNYAIRWAAYNGHLAVVGLLLKYKRVDPSAGDNNAIQWAAKNGHLAVVERLLQDKRVDPSAYDNYAIRWAAENGHLAVVERLLQDKRVDPSAHYNNAIRRAALNDHLIVIERLLQDKRVDSSADKNYAIRWAAESGHLTLVERLLQDNRVDPSADDNYAIRWAARNGHLAVVERLLQDKRVDPTRAISLSREPAIIELLHRNLHHQ